MFQNLATISSRHERGLGATCQRNRGLAVCYPIVTQRNDSTDVLSIDSTILRAASTKYDRRLLTVQLASIATTMLLSAYQFLQGVRLMTHAGFMFPVKKDTTKVDNIMRQTQNCQWLGLRWMYVSLAPISWVVGGSRAYLVVSLLLLQFFRTIDKQPEGLGYEEFQAENI